MHEIQFDDLYGAPPAEEISTGSISTMTYVRYFRAGGHCLILFFVLVLFVLAEVGQSNCAYAGVNLLCSPRSALLQLIGGYLNGE